MERLIFIGALVLSIFGSFHTTASHAQTPLQTLVLYDAPTSGGYQKLGLAYAIMLRNLLGHFEGTVDLLPVQEYTAGRVENYKTIFYLGANYDNPLPAAWLQDVSTTNKTVVWFRYNIWQLAWNPAYNFSTRTGLNFTGLRGLNTAPSSSNPNPGFFDRINYKGRTFQKYYTYDSSSGIVNADPDLGHMQIIDAAKASTIVPVRNSANNEEAPYVVRTGNFWYVGDMPFSYIGPRDRYLVLADILHDIVGIAHAEKHEAMVRFEDIDAKVNVANMRKLSDYLNGQRIPYSLAAIPHYRDPRGHYNNGVPQDIPLAQAADLKSALTYAVNRLGEIVQHGYTHQYSNIPNPSSGVSGDDFEFWNAVQNTPVAEDSINWATERIQAGRQELVNNGYQPVAWETPHYQSSPKAIRAVPPIYNKTYQRVVYYTSDTPNLHAGDTKDFAVGQFFPYVIQRDYYGQKVIPENLGNFEYDLSHIDPASNIVYTWEDLYTNAQYSLAVRDGMASFFFHPFLLDPALQVPAYTDLQKLINGINGLGYTWTSPSRIP